MGILSLIWGILALIGTMIGIIPCLGALNWLNIPFGALGFLISIIALATAKEDGKVPAVVGLVFCCIAVVFGAIRLVLGGGIV